MHPIEDLGIAHFLSHSDLLTRGILVVLVRMSLISWYLILSRALAHALDWRRSAVLLHALPRLRSLPAFADHSHFRNQALTRDGGDTWDGDCA